VAAVEGKVDTLERVAERRVQEATAARARRTGNVLSALTALTVVTVAITVLGGIVGTRSDESGHEQLRYLTAGAAFLLAIAIYLLTRWRIGRRGVG
jgi:Mg2+ and Co2+ transporter CorA